MHIPNYSTRSQTSGRTVGDYAARPAMLFDPGSVLEVHAKVWAVAASSPGLWSSQESEALAESMGIGAPMQWVERDGEVECLVYAPMGVSAEGSVEDVEVNVLQCQLVDDGVTILLEGRGFDTAGGADILRDIAANLKRG